MKSIYLKVKIKSLTSESKIIRKEEVKKKKQGDILKAKISEIKESKDRSEEAKIRITDLREYKAKLGFVQFDLHNHRTQNVRIESRHSLIAYGYIRGLSYKQIENSPKEEPNWDKVEKLIKRFSNNPFDDNFFPSWQEGDLCRQSENMGESMLPK